MTAPRTGLTVAWPLCALLLFATDGRAADGDEIRAQLDSSRLPRGQKVFLLHIPNIGLSPMRSSPPSSIR